MPAQAIAEDIFGQGGDEVANLDVSRVRVRSASVVIEDDEMGGIASAAVHQKSKELFG